METRIVELLKEIKSLIKENSSNKWMNINEASKYCAVHPSTIRRSLKSGELKASKTLGKHLFKQSELEKWLS